MGIGEGQFGRAARRWGGRGFWAIVDQGTFAGANFLLNVLLARWLTATEYGAFAVAFSLFLFLSTFHAALLIEPMLVFGPGKFSARFGHYLQVLLKAHLVVSAAIAAVLGVLAVVLRLLGNGDAMLPTLLALGGASPFILYQWLMRRSCYVHLNPRTAALAGSGYLLTTVAGAWLLFRVDALSAVSAIGLMAVGSILAGAYIARATERIDDDASLSSTFGREVLHEHWRYGRWAVASAALTWVPGNLFYVALPARAGLEATAALRAVVNLTIPMVQFTGALGAILMPAMVRARDAGGLGRLMRNALLLFSVLGLGYYLVIAAFHQPITAWLYAGRYDAYAQLIWIVGLLPLSTSLTVVLGAVLRAREVPSKVFWSYVVSSIVAVALAALTLAPLGVMGGAIGMVVTSLATTTAMATFVIGMRSRRGPSNRTPAASEGDTV